MATIFTLAIAGGPLCAAAAFLIAHSQQGASIMRAASYGIALGLLCLIAAPSVRAAEMTGIAVYTVDGDTFDLRVGDADVRIRVCGIDSPERGQGGYRAATALL
jgi:endonuclease YncB( thermonuclease family)